MKEILTNIFQSLLVTYLLLLLIEEIIPGFVSNYLNLNYLLIIVIGLGIAEVFYGKQQKPKPTTKKDIYLTYTLGLLGFVILKYKTADLQVLSWIISIIGGILIILLGLLILEDEKRSKKR
jgi:hypothetical protein